MPMLLLNILRISLPDVLEGAMEKDRVTVGVGEITVSNSLQLTALQGNSPWQMSQVWVWTGSFIFKRKGQGAVSWGYRCGLE